MISHSLALLYLISLVRSARAHSQESHASSFDPPVRIRPEAKIIRRKYLCDRAETIVQERNSLPSKHTYIPSSPDIYRPESIRKCLISSHLANGHVHADIFFTTVTRGRPTLPFSCGVQRSFRLVPAASDEIPRSRRIERRTGES